MRCRLSCTATTLPRHVVRMLRESHIPHNRTLGVLPDNHRGAVRSGGLAASAYWHWVCDAFGMNRSRMMLAVLLGLSITGLGCRSHARTAANAKEPIKPAGLNTQDYEAVTASALVFDPPAAEYSVAIVPSREGRERTAFVGYDSVISTYFYLRVDDLDRFFDPNGDGRYERRAVSEKFGVSQR